MTALSKENLSLILLERLNKPYSPSSKSEMEILIEELIEIIKNGIEHENEVQIKNFGKWLTRKKRSRPGRNPHTGERIEILPKKVVLFHPSTRLRKAMNK